MTSKKICESIMQKIAPMVKKAIKEYYSSEEQFDDLMKQGNILDIAKKALKDAGYYSHNPINSYFVLNVPVKDFNEEKDIRRILNNALHPEEELEITTDVKPSGFLNTKVYLPPFNKCHI